MLNTANQVVIYTDGSSIGNPGPGGYGIVMKAGERRREMSHGFKRTTNNRMELLAVIVALETLKKDGLEVIVYSDSKYVVDAVEKKWVFGWQKKNFDKKANPDLWKRFLKVYPKHQIRFKWVKGHAGNSENERCDQLATEAAARKELSEDTGYTGNVVNPSLFSE